jgi:hypothetical protein
MFVLVSLALHSVEYQCSRIFALRSMPIFLFGCVDIWYLELISYLNTKLCLDGQSDVLHLKMIFCVTSNMLPARHRMAQRSPGGCRSGWRIERRRGGIAKDDVGGGRSRQSGDDVRWRAAPQEGPLGLRGPSWDVSEGRDGTS